MLPHPLHFIFYFITVALRVISSEQLIELCRRPEAERGVKPGSVCPQRPLWVLRHRLPDGSRLGPRALLSDQSPRPGGMWGESLGALACSVPL